MSDKGERAMTSLKHYKGTHKGHRNNWENVHLQGRISAKKK